MSVEAAAKRLYLHNVADYAEDRTEVEAMWDNNAEVRDFWIGQAKVVLG